MLQVCSTESTELVIIKDIKVVIDELVPNFYVRDHTFLAMTVSLCGPL